MVRCHEDQLVVPPVSSFLLLIDNCLSIFFLVVTFIDKSGRRVTTESSYLTNDVLRRKNLTIAIHVGVTRVLFSNGTLTKKEDSLGLGASEVEPRAVGVEFAREYRKEERFVVRAAKEVILWCVLAFPTHNYFHL